MPASSHQGPATSQDRELVPQQPFLGFWSTDSLKKDSQRDERRKVVIGAHKDARLKKSYHCICGFHRLTRFASVRQHSHILGIEWCPPSQNCLWCGSLYSCSLCWSSSDPLWLHSLAQKRTSNPSHVVHGLHRSHVSGRIHIPLPGRPGSRLSGVDPHRISHMSLSACVRHTTACGCEVRSHCFAP